MCTRAILHLLVVFGMLVMYGCFNVGGNLPVSAGIVAAVSTILPIFAAITAIAAAVAAVAAVATVAAPVAAAPVAAAGFSVRRRRRVHLHRGVDLLLDGHVAHRNRGRGARLHALHVGLPLADQRSL